MNAVRIGLALFALALTAGCDTNPSGPSAAPAAGAAATAAPADAGGAPEGGTGGRRQMGGRSAKPKTGSQPATAD